MASTSDLSHFLQSHQYLNSCVAYPGIPPENSIQHEGNISTCHGTLFSDYSDLGLKSKSDKISSPERGFSQYHTGASLSSTALR